MAHLTYWKFGKKKIKKELECVAAKLYHGDNEVSMHNILQEMQNR